MTEENNVTTPQQEETIINPPQSETGWFDSMPDDVKSLPSIQKFKGKQTSDLARAHNELSKLLGQPKILMPKSDTDTEGWNQLWDKIGRPKTAEEYSFKQNYKIPDNIKNLVKDEKLNEFKKFAHERGLTNKQFQELVEWHFNETSSQVNDFIAQQKTSFDESMNKLRTEWGARFNDKLSKAQMIFNNFIDPQDREFFNLHGNNPAVVRTLSKMAEAISEDSIKSGAPATFTMSKAEAQSEYDSLMKDFSSPYWNEKHPDHRNTRDRVRKLAEVIYA